MNAMDDDRLETLLRETFASREHLADPAAADHLARTATARPRRWPAYAAAAAAIVVVAGVGAYAVGGPDDDPPVVAPSSPSTRTAAPARTYAENRALAAAESARVVELVPLPEVAVRLTGRPDGWPSGGTYLGPSDGTLTQTRWWTVPGSAADLEAFLLSHEPPGLHREDGVGSSSDLEGHYVRELTYAQDRSPDPEAFTGVSLLVQWLDIGDHTVVRADTFTAARAVRAATSYLDGVSAVDVSRVIANIPRRQQPVRARLVDPEDHESIATLVRAVNALPASIEPPFAGSCPFPGDPEPSLELTFHTAEGTVVVHLDTWCFGQVEVTRDGVRLEPTLDPGDLAQVVSRLLGVP